jgi:hypothetical protein
MEVRPVTPDACAQPGEVSPADGPGPRALLRYRSAQGRWVVAAMILGSSVAGIDSTVVVVALPPITGLTGGAYADPMRFRSSFGQMSWICAAAFACAALLSATFITGPRRRTPARQLALIQTPVPHLACPVALRHTPRQTRKPNDSQASNRSRVTNTPPPSRPE